MTANKDSQAERTKELQRVTYHATEQLAPAHKAVEETAWNLATKGDDESAAAHLEARTNANAKLADPERYLSVRRLTADSDGDDPKLARGLTLLEREMSTWQGHLDLRNDITQKEVALQHKFDTHRGTIDGKPHSDVELRRILTESHDVSLRKNAWEAVHHVGAAVADDVIALVKARNELAKANNYRDFFEMQLEQNELSEESLFSTLAKLEKATRAPFRTRRAVHDAERGRAFNLATEELKPWHYRHPQFQTVQAPDSLKLDAYYANEDLEVLAARFFDGLGMNVRDILKDADLAPREGKAQHAFCANVDRDKDIRVFANLEANEAGMRELLRTLGHAAYSRYIRQPWLLAKPAHSAMKEAVSMLMERQASELEFLLEYMDLPAFELTPLSGEIRRLQCFRMQAFVRWALVVIHFEQLLYANPERDDLNAQWWALKKKYQLIEPPADRDAPDWAAERHLALQPVYYPNYVFGELIASQLRQFIIEQARVGSIVDSLYAGELLIQEVFRHGAAVPWDTLVENATREPLNVDHFVREFTA